MKAAPNEAGQYDVTIDGVLRFRIEGDGQWPAQWRLYPVTDGVRDAAFVALENEYMDLVAKLERGEHWMAAEDVQCTEAPVARDATYTRWPEYLPEY